MSDEARVRSTARSFVPFVGVCGKCGAMRIDRQIGLEPTPDEYLATMVAVMREVRRVLRPDGTCWVNMGDSYASNGPGSWGSSDKSTLTTSSRNGAWAPGKTIGTTGAHSSGAKPKDLLLMPARLALALQADGWWLRSDIIWAKPNPMPESVTDRPTSAHEHVFLLTKSARYFYDADAVREAQPSFAGAYAIRVLDDVGKGIGARRSLSKHQAPRQWSKRWRYCGNPSGRNLAQRLDHRHRTLS